ncbi:hypothetical protein ACFPYJ_20120 [Paenibacillus solisilvae]|uniref:Zinc ribbon domain-containing protein n=1 Tax=Paenibacillus solisilvae TaxID=2486751 RepID=A0ABW0VZP2_9BACL
MRGGMFPLLSMMNAAATSIVLMIAAALIGVMVVMIRLMTTSDDDGKYKQLREFVEALFGTPAHLRPESSGNKEAGAAKEKSVHAVSAEPFSEPCPACQETITQEHEECPSCGLRLL